MVCFIIEYTIIGGSVVLYVSVLPGLSFCCCCKYNLLISLTGVVQNTSSCAAKRKGVRGSHRKNTTPKNNSKQYVWNITHYLFSRTCLTLCISYVAYTIISD